MNEVCGTCKHNHMEWDDSTAKYREKIFYCDNERGDYYGVPTAYDDTCEYWERRS